MIKLIIEIGKKCTVFMKSVKCGISYHEFGKKWDAGVSQYFLYAEEAMKQEYRADSCLYWLFHPGDDMLINNKSQLQ